MVLNTDLREASARLVAACVHKKLSLAGAESCTGGLMAATITGLAGVSSIFLGCIVSYANSAKLRLLEVPEAILASDGAVSENCAAAMARGAAAAFGADVAWSITGIAGPDGGTIQKPVGYVCFAYFVRGQIWTENRQFAGTRDSIREQAVTQACQSLSSHLANWFEHSKNSQ